MGKGEKWGKFLQFWCETEKRLSFIGARAWHHMTSSLSWEIPELCKLKLKLKLSFELCIKECKKRHFITISSPTKISSMLACLPLHRRPTCHCIDVQPATASTTGLPLHRWLTLNWCTAHCLTTCRARDPTSASSSNSSSCSNYRVSHDKQKISCADMQELHCCATARQAYIFPTRVVDHDTIVPPSFTLSLHESTAIFSRKLRKTQLFLLWPH